MIDVEALQNAILDHTLRKLEHEARKAKAEADQAELILEHVRKNLETMALPAINAGTVKS